MACKARSFLTSWVGWRAEPCPLASPSCIKPLIWNKSHVSYGRGRKLDPCPEVPQLTVWLQENLFLSHFSYLMFKMGKLDMICSFQINLIAFPTEVLYGSPIAKIGFKIYSSWTSPIFLPWPLNTFMDTIGLWHFGGNLKITRSFKASCGSHILYV